MKNFKFECDTDGVYKSAAMWLFHFFINKTAFAEVNARLSADSTGKKHSQLAISEKRYFSIYPRVVSVSLKKYATDEVIAQTKSSITSFVQPSYLTPSQYAEEPVK